MRIYQQPLDEYTLWDHLQNRKFERAIEVIDWYYSFNNPHGFDDPSGITKADYLESCNKVPTDLTKEYKIRKRRMSYGAPLIAMGLFLIFFVFLSVKANSWGPMLILSPLAPFALYAIIMMLFDREPIVTINPNQLEFRKSKLQPIKWDNILQIYFYRRKPVFGTYIFADANFIKVYKKDAVKPESFNIKDLELKPVDIVRLVNEYKKKYEQ